MKHMDMNTVISWGLVAMGILSVAGWVVFSIQTGTSGGTEIPIAIVSGLVGVLTGKNMANSKDTQTIENTVRSIAADYISNKINDKINDELIDRIRGQANSSNGDNKK